MMSFLALEILSRDQIAIPQGYLRELNDFQGAHQPFDSMIVKPSQSSLITSYLLFLRCSIACLIVFYSLLTIIIKIKFVLNFFLNYGLYMELYIISY